MAEGWKYAPKSGLARLVNDLEENAIALMLGLMTLLTFVNVILRKGFNDSIIWSQEVVLTLFAWLVLFGVAYAFKVTAHLGVDAILNIVSPPLRRALGVLGALVCLVYALLILKGAWDYWAPFANLPPTTGRWLPTGFDWAKRGTPFFETDQIPMPGFLRVLEGWINSGEAYSKLPRMVPYAMLPVAALLILLRITQATLRIVAGDQDRLIVSHEAEDAVAEVAALNRDT